MYKNLDLMMSSYQKHVHYKESGKVMCKRKWLLYRLKTKIKEAPASVFLIAVKQNISVSHSFSHIEPCKTLSDCWTTKSDAGR